MGERMIRIGSVLLISIAWITIGSFVSSQVSLADEEGKRGCKTCHSKLSETLPKGHPSVEQEEVKSCLTCHVTKGEAAPWEWIVHFWHYSEEAFSGDCWSCHLIDKAGDFTAYDSNSEKVTVKASREDMGRMAFYYNSWGTSGYLDHRHGLKKLDCNDCHGGPFPKGGAPTERCVSCHGGYDQLGQKSSMHSSGLYAHFSDKEVGCNACHKAHQESALVCNQCHTFDQKVP